MIHWFLSFSSVLKMAKIPAFLYRQYYNIIPAPHHSVRKGTNFLISASLPPCASWRSGAWAAEEMALRSLPAEMNWIPRFSQNSTSSSAVGPYGNADGHPRPPALGNARHRSGPRTSGWKMSFRWPMEPDRSQGPRMMPSRPGEPSPSPPGC